MESIAQQALSLSDHNLGFIHGLTKQHMRYIHETSGFILGRKGVN